MSPSDTKRGGSAKNKEESADDSEGYNYVSIHVISGGVSAKMLSCNRYIFILIV